MHIHGLVLLVEVQHLKSLDFFISLAPILGSFSQDKTKAVTKLLEEALCEISIHDRTQTGGRNILVSGNRKPKDPT